MHFVRLGEYFAVSRITGPQHNLLQLRLCEDEQGQPSCEQLPPQGECRHEPLIESKIISSVIEGAAEANQRLGTSYAITHIRYIENDTKPEVVYGYMAMKLIEHLHAGGIFHEGASVL